MTSNGPFGPLEFQLVLLRRMADHQPELVDDARRELGVSLADMREANRRWQAMVRGPRARQAVSRYRSVLGEPESVTRRRIGDLECEALLWPVALWPGLRFEVMTAPGGAVWNEWLVRAPGEPGPELRTAEDLLPWSCTVDEVARAFPPAEPLPGTAPTRTGLRFTLPGGNGHGAGGQGSGHGAGNGYGQGQAHGYGQGHGYGHGSDGGVRVAEFTWGLLQRWTA